MAVAGVRPGLELRAVDDEAVLHVALQRALVGLVDLVRGGVLDLAGNAVFPAVIQHFLGLGDTAHQRAHHLAVPKDERERA